MALHSRDAVTVSAAVATRSRTDCSSREGHTSGFFDWIVGLKKRLKVKVTFNF